LIGDDRTSGEGDVADMFGDEIGLPGRSSRGGNARRHSAAAEFETDDDDDERDGE